MLPRIASRSLWCALLLALGALQPAARAQPATPPKTRNVVLIVSDGLRWQEIFTGADPLLLNGKNGGIWDKEQDLRREFWRADPDERRRALFPFLWTTVATRGQVFGNQAKGSIARVTNGLAFSYPGYNEMLTGQPDPRITSNQVSPNPHQGYCSSATARLTTGRTRAATTWCCTARTYSMGSSRSSGKPCRACRRIAIRLPSSSRRIMAAAADRSIGRSTASGSQARKTSG